MRPRESPTLTENAGNIIDVKTTDSDADLHIMRVDETVSVYRLERLSL